VTDVTGNLAGAVAAGDERLHREAVRWLEHDQLEVEAALGDECDRLAGTSILVTGACGFLGFQLLHFFSALNRRCRGPIRVVGTDSALLGTPRWTRCVEEADPLIEYRHFDVTAPWPDGERFDYILHAASVASPVYYRRFALETVDANVNGLRNMLELARRGDARGVLFFSSSEVYGDPPGDEIPTREHYRGNVGCVGPRACYDESKRLGETLCWIYAHQYGTAAMIARPFNNYGPGLRLTDGRVVPDLFRAVLEDRDIVLHSDGTPSRTLCYASDALAGYIRLLLSGRKGEAFNIGSAEPEISMRDLAELVLRVTGSTRSVVHQPSDDAAYLCDSPARRCPDIGKARCLLGYDPAVGLEDGLHRMWDWYRRFSPLEASV